MRVLRFQYEMRLILENPARDHHFEFRCLPMEGGGQHVLRLEYGIEPAGSVRERTDGFGNRVCYGEVTGPHDSLRLMVNGAVRVGCGERENGVVQRDGHGGRENAAEQRTGRGEQKNGAVQRAGDSEQESAAGQRAGRGERENGAGRTAPSARGDTGPDRDIMRAAGPAGQVPVIVYAYPSELTRPDAAMAAWLAQVGHEYEKSAPSRAPDGRERADIKEGFAEYLMHRLHERLSYVRGATHVGTTAAEAFALGKGVCQDHAHVFIALCRMAGLPARYVTGMVPGEGETHAWAEVWLGGAWTAFDPTCDRRPGDRCIKLAHGRDFADCPVDRGCFKGSGGQRQTVHVKVEEDAAEGTSG